MKPTSLRRQAPASDNMTLVQMSTICRPDIRSTSFQDRSESEFILPCGVQRAKRSSSFYIVNFDIYAATIPAKTEIHIVSKLVKCTCSPGLVYFTTKNGGRLKPFFFSKLVQLTWGSLQNGQIVQLSDFRQTCLLLCICKQTILN